MGYKHYAKEGSFLGSARALAKPFSLDPDKNLSAHNASHKPATGPRPRDWRPEDWAILALGTQPARSTIPTSPCVE